MTMNEAKILESIKSEIQNAFKGLDPKFGSLETKFGSLETKFGSLETKFGSIETKFGSIETKFGSIETKFGSIETKFGSLETKFNSLEEQFRYQRADIIELKEKVIAAFDSSSRLPEVAHKVDEHGNRIEVLEQKSAVFKTAIENLSK
jgi:chromosome segregation ATPase